jgi:hypothetical protein
MEQLAPRRFDDDTRLLRRTLIAVALVLVAVAIYAGAFIMLAPMMQ